MKRIKILYLLRGIPGSGKSTLAYNMKGLVFESDLYFLDEAGNYQYDPKELQSANNWCYNSVMDAMEKSLKLENQEIYDKIIVANNFITERELEPYYKIAKRYNYHIFSIIVENRHQDEEEFISPDIKELINRFEIKLK